jgi:hypothetical protein
MKQFFSFPNPVNDAAARTVALGVVAMATLALVFNQPLFLIPLTYGFLARVLAGPKISPLGTFAVKVAAPRLKTWEKMVAGPPKRFAQGIGLAFSASASLVYLTAGWSAARWILLPLVAAAALEGFVGYCLGCAIFGQLMKAGLIPEEVCVDCADITRRYATSSK